MQQPSAHDAEIIELKELIEHLCVGATDSAQYIKSLEQTVAKHKDELTIAYMAGFTNGAEICKQCLKTKQQDSQNNGVTQSK